MMHSTHFIYSYMVKDHSDNERGNLLLPLHELLFPIIHQGVFYVHHPIYRTVHTMAFVTAALKQLLEREIAQWVH